MGKTTRRGEPFQPSVAGSGVNKYLLDSLNLCRWSDGLFICNAIESWLVLKNWEPESQEKPKQHIF